MFLISSIAASSCSFEIGRGAVAKMFAGAFSSLITSPSTGVALPLVSVSVSVKL